MDCFLIVDFFSRSHILTFDTENSVQRTNKNENMRINLLNLRVARDLTELFLWSIGLKLRAEGMMNEGQAIFS